MPIGRNILFIFVGAVVLQIYSSYANFRPGWNFFQHHIQDKEDYFNQQINFKKNRNFFLKNQANQENQENQEKQGKQENQENQEIVSFEINYSTYYHPPVFSVWDWSHFLNLFTQIWEFGKETFWEEESIHSKGQKVFAAASFWVPKKTWQIWRSDLDSDLLNSDAQNLNFRFPSFATSSTTSTKKEKKETKKPKKKLKVLVWLHGTSGIYPRCAPANNPKTEIQNIPLFEKFLQNGWAIFAPQYLGLEEVKNYSVPLSSLVVHPYLFARSFISSLQDAFFSFQVCATKIAKDARFVEEDSLHACSFLVHEGLGFLAEFSPFYEVSFSVYGFSEGGFGALWLWTSLTTPRRFVQHQDSKPWNRGEEVVDKKGTRFWPLDLFAATRGFGYELVYRAPISSIVAVSSPIDLKKSFLNSRESVAGKVLTLFVIYSLALLEPNFFQIEDVIRPNSIPFTNVIHTACVDSEEDLHWSFLPFFAFLSLPADTWFHSNWESLPSWSAFLMENSVPLLDSQNIFYWRSMWPSLMFFFPFLPLDFDFDSFNQDEKYSTPFVDSTYPLLLIHGQKDELVDVESVQEWAKKTKELLPKTSPFRLSIWKHVNHSSVLNASSMEALAWMEYFWNK